MSTRWRISELGEAVMKALQHVDYESSNNGQISSVPNARTIRYYTTLGLIDGPAEMRGRTAFYDRRHLVQLVAIKRLQSAGKSLAQVQEILQGAPKSKLESIADLQGFSFKSTHKTQPTPAKTQPGKKYSRNDEHFWEQQHTESPVAAPTPISIEAKTEIALAPGVCILIDADIKTRALDEKTRSAIITKANELLALLVTPKVGDS